jgi:oligopeptide transport system substrate-binding protein
MERLYGADTYDIVAELAHHYYHAQIGNPDLTEKAIDYLQRAGDQERVLQAHREAIAHYELALELLRTLRNHESAARTLMKLGLTYHTAFDFGRSRQAYDEGFRLWQHAAKAEPVARSAAAPAPLRLFWWDPPTLDPAMTRAAEIVIPVLGLQLFSGLAEESTDMEVVPDIARSWDVAERGTAYTFHLRDDARWSDGVPVTAADFEAAWKRVLDPATAAPRASLLYDIKGARAYHQGELSDAGGIGVYVLDDHTLRVELEGPVAYFPHLVAHCICYPVPRHALAAQGQYWANHAGVVTNGPFRIVSWSPTESMVLERNPQYHGSFRGNVERVELTLGNYSPEHHAMYESDELDLDEIHYLPPPVLEEARRQHADEYFSMPNLFVFYIGFDLTRPPFDDQRVRRAFVHAVDRDTFANVVARGQHMPGTGGMIPPGMWGHSPQTGLTFDPARARRLLAEAGYAGERGFPQVEFLVPDMPVALRSIQFVWDQWQQHLGLELPMTALNWTALWRRLREAPPHVFHSCWGPDYPDPDSFLRASTIRRDAGWRSERYDRLVEEARRIANQNTRMAMYTEADRMLVEQAVVMPRVYTLKHFLVKPWVKRYPAAPNRHWFWKDVIVESH